jgi:uncharacterized protein
LKRYAGKRAATRFDALKLAENGEEIAGEVVATRLSRIADSVVEPSEPDTGRIRWRIAGRRDQQGRPALTLRLEGGLAVVCQRCLRPLAMTIDQQTELLVARDEPDLARLDAEEQEVVLAASPVDALTLVEDELLLSLPFAPCHKKGECMAAVAPMPSIENALSPFSPLVGLKTGSRSRS